MSNKVTLGGERLGAGNKMKVGMHGYNRSTHNISSIWRSTMAPGTLVPFLVEPLLPGDTLDINLSTMVRTLPTNGPVFGSFKMQMDIFFCPVRLYSRQMHNNKLGIGLHMDKILLPLQDFYAKKLAYTGTDPNLQQINSSCLLKYLGTSGFGNNPDLQATQWGFGTSKQALPQLMYWDIYKNYYANKQEEIGVFVGSNTNQTFMQVTGWTAIVDGVEATIPQAQITLGDRIVGSIAALGSQYMILWGSSFTPASPQFINIVSDETMSLVSLDKWCEEKGVNLTITPDRRSIILRKDNAFTATWKDDDTFVGIDQQVVTNENLALIQFPLSNIDDMRENILAQNNQLPFRIQYSTPYPYGYLSQWTNGGDPTTATQSDVPLITKTMAGLGIKTYMSDRFNNWLNTEWIDGENGINAITAVDTSSGSFTQDALLLAQKVYNMLNRIALSGGSMHDYIESVYDIKSARLAESPMYMGGMSSEIVFNEVVSTADAQASDTGETQPLGTLGGRGNVNNVKGGRVRVKANEWGFCIGIVSITPRIDYSQGNRWFTRLETMDQWHKPAMDAIGFQEMITDEIAAWDTVHRNQANEYNSGGKQPAWIEYMTNINECYGEFAEENKLMFMTLNRQYTAGNNMKIRDLTTYIDPTKYNYIFATRTLETQGFWVQIAKDMKARRVMSAKIMPTL